LLAGRLSGIVFLPTLGPLFRLRIFAALGFLRAMLI
jgi:hypothetical protein